MTEEIDLGEYLKNYEYQVWEIMDNVGVESSKDRVQKNAFVKLARLRKQKAELEQKNERLCKYIKELQEIMADKYEKDFRKSLNFGLGDGEKIIEESKEMLEEKSDD